jgi:hypothetical protein
MIRITKMQWYVATQKQKETKTNEEVLAKITMRSTTIIAKTSKMIAELHKLHSKINAKQKESAIIQFIEEENSDFDSVKLNRS